ncbi:MAG: hypothetical protein QM778_24620 [Myxococcales bacterium]
MKSAWTLCLACALFVCSLPATCARADEKGESIYLDMYGALLNQYYFRGMRQASKGVVMQGAADMRVALYDEDEFKFHAGGGAFVSFHPGDQRGGDTLSASLLEARGWLGLGVWTPTLEISGRFLAYTSPNGSFGDVYELDLLGVLKDDVYWAGPYDDQTWRGFFPSITFAQEVSGARDGQNMGTYLELGMAPRLRLLHGAILGLDFVFPASVGLNLHDYYQFRPAPGAALKNYGLGFAAVGFQMDFDERWVPERLGGWHAKAGCDVIFPKAEHDAGVRFVNTAALVAHGDVVLDF